MAKVEEIGPDQRSDEHEVNEMDRKVLDQQRRASGGLTDDPTMSGEPVKNRHSFRITNPGNRP